MNLKGGVDVLDGHEAALGLGLDLVGFRGNHPNEFY